jgi:DNA modification methylase
MQTEHKIFFADARILNDIETESVDLVVTSPPYPLIEMWDELFSALNPAIKETLATADYQQTFELMHGELDKVWQELLRVLKPGGFACINIGDATRTIQNRFQLFANHSRIQQYCFKTGFDVLPSILWRKQTNAPNKFMGSGMLPAGAYVTLEHEYILILRKGGKRLFSTEAARENRMQSALFWEERNTWFSDVWDLKGTRQRLNDESLRSRSAAFPFEIAFRLINMYSVIGDTVLDPFLGTGTTLFAAAACGRNSLDYELDPCFSTHIGQSLLTNTELYNSFNLKRLENHIRFLKTYPKEIKHKNGSYGFPVVTRQETKLSLPLIKNIEAYSDNNYLVHYLNILEMQNLLQNFPDDMILQTT